MERHFALPVIIALAAHGSLLFGSKSKILPRLNKPETTVVEIVDCFHVPPVEEEIVSDVPRGTDCVAAPTNPEPPSVIADSPFKFVPTAVSPTPVTGLREIPKASPGDINGTLETRIKPGVISSDLLDAAPHARTQPSPIYPHEARRGSMTGQVDVEFVVNETGAVIQARSVRATNPIFVDAALRAVERWRFAPGKRDGKVVSFKMVVPIHFNLNDE